MAKSNIFYLLSLEMGYLTLYIDLKAVRGECGTTNELLTKTGIFSTI